MAQILGNISAGGESTFFLPNHIGPVTVSVNGLPASIVYQDADNVVLENATAEDDLVEIFYVAPDLTFGGTGPQGPVGPVGPTGPQGQAGAAGPGVAAGGSTGQLLVKSSNTDYATSWQNFPTLQSLSTGSGLVFDGTNLGLNTIPTNYGAGYRTFAMNGTTATQIDFRINGVIKSTIYSSGTLLQFNGAVAQIWTINNTEWMRLNVSGGLTLAAGTANGVAYLNGSKVLTMGSALTFNGTNLGIGTSAATSKLHVTGLPVYADNAAALAGGMTAGAFYRTATGELRVTI